MEKSRNRLRRLSSKKKKRKMTILTHLSKILAVVEGGNEAEEAVVEVDITEVVAENGKVGIEMMVIKKSGEEEVEVVVVGAAAEAVVDTTKAEMENKSALSLTSSLYR